MPWRKGPRRPFPGHKKKSLASMLTSLQQPKEASSQTALFFSEAESRKEKSIQRHRLGWFIHRRRVLLCLKICYIHVTSSSFHCHFHPIEMSFDPQELHDSFFTFAFAHLLLSFFKLAANISLTVTNRVLFLQSNAAWQIAVLDTKVFGRRMAEKSQSNQVSNLSSTTASSPPFASIFFDSKTLRNEVTHGGLEFGLAPRWCKPGSGY